MTTVRRRPLFATGVSRDVRLAVVGGTLASALVMYVTCALCRRFGFATDFPHEAWPAYRALEHGHVVSFFRLGPPYVGSLLLRAPLALLAMALGAGWQTTYFISALPCLAAGPMLAAWLARRAPGSAERRWPLWTSPLVMTALSPVVAIALMLGHPEEILGACFALAAVVLAAEGSAPARTGLLLALAVINKPWAVVVVPVVFAVMPQGRVRALLSFAMISPIPYILLFLTQSGGIAGPLAGATGTIFFPTYLGWWFGPGAWMSRNAHALIIVVGFVCGAVWWLLRGRDVSSPQQRRENAICLVALVFLLRAALDPWNSTYYELPFLVTLMVLEFGRAPKLSWLFTVLLTLAVWPGVVYEGGVVLHVVAYDLVAVPTLIVLAVRVFAPAPVWRALVGRALSRGRGSPGLGAPAVAPSMPVG